MIAKFEKKQTQKPPEQHRRRWLYRTGLAPASLLWAPLWTKHQLKKKRAWLNAHAFALLHCIEIFSERNANLKRREHGLTHTRFLCFIA
jgi:hypothetical protein